MTDLLDEIAHPASPLRDDHAELGAMAADGVDQHGALAHQQLTGPVQHEHGLPLGALDRNEPHRRAGHRLTDRLGVGGVVLLPPDIGLHIRRRHQPHLVPQRRQLARPVVRRGAASRPTRHGGWTSKTLSTSDRRSFFLRVT